MKKYVYGILIMIAIVGLCSCRGANAKKAIDVAKKYTGKVFSKSEKKTMILRNGDDIVRHLEFQKVECVECEGNGIINNETCEVCTGDGYVYKIKSK